MRSQTFSVPMKFRRTLGKWNDPNRQEFVTQVDVEIEINFEQIARHLGFKALTNKGGKARGMSGAIVVRCKNARRI